MIEHNYKNFSSIEDFSCFGVFAGFVLNHPTPPSNGILKGPPTVKYVSADFFSWLKVCNCFFNILI